MDNGRLLSIGADEITIRELKVANKILVTTILSPRETSKQSLKELYKARWHVEWDFRNIKSTMGMETFSCKSPDMVEKEMWIYLLAYNLIRLIMAQSASLADILPRQTSFKHSLQIWLAYRQQNGTLYDENLGTMLDFLKHNAAHTGASLRAAEGCEVMRLVMHLAALEITFVLKLILLPIQPL